MALKDVDVKSGPQASGVGGRWQAIHLTGLNHG